MYKEEYNEFVDRLCDSTCKVTAADILNKAKQGGRNVILFCNDDSGELDVELRDKEETEKNHCEIVEDDRKANTIRKKGLGAKRWVRIAAACIAILVIPSVTLAAGGRDFFVKMFRDYFKDETTAKIVEKGHLGEVKRRQASADGKFDVTLQAVTGDKEHAIVVMDIKVNDSAIVKSSDDLRLEVYALGVPEFEDEEQIVKIRPSVGYAIRDKKIDNLYHLEVNCAPAFLQPNSEAVVYIDAIESHDEAGKLQTDYPNIKYQFIVPQYALSPVTYVHYPTKETFEYGEFQFMPVSETYGKYECSIQFEFGYISPEAEHGEIDEFQLWQELVKAWDSSDKMKLVVDGTEYEIDEVGAPGYNNNQWYLIVWFPSVDYVNAQEVSLKYDGKEIKLKGK